jgi:DNA-binding CsgD family transcriptional regulator/tetratricopeptide (TPR) repeat protein/transcriptional regulator with XRE-family HTH domain
VDQVSVTRQVADSVRYLRVQRRWSAQQLAEECARAGATSLTRGTIAKIESSRRKHVTADELAVLAQVLQVSPADLLTPPAYQPSGTSRSPGDGAAHAAADSWLPARRIPGEPDRFVGRASELATLTRLVKDLAAGQGDAVLIEGEPGIGKSALVRAAVAGTADLGCEVFWGIGDELGQALPLLPFLDGLRVREQSDNPRRHAIARLLRGEDTADRGTDVPAVLAEQLLALIADQCAAQPTVLVIDDLQWADHASITLWGQLARAVGQIPLLLIGMMRPVPQREDLLALRHTAGATRMHLGGLDTEVAAELIQALVGGKPGDNLMELADGASGNPLYLTELVDALARSSSLTISDVGSAELVSQHAPGSLSVAIADRLRFLPAWVREVLRAAALLGVDFAVPDLAIVLGRGVADLIPAFDEARVAGVLAESGTGLGFRHPLIRAALYEEIPLPVRAAWHREAGRALADAGAPADRVARQLLQATGRPGAMAEPMDEWVLSWLGRTADLLVGQAPKVAAELLRQAVANSPTGSARHDLLLSRLADALYRIGDAAGAEQMANQALAHAVEPDLLVDLHWTLAQCRMLVGRSEESLATLKQALNQQGVSARNRARLLVAIARAHRELGQIEEAGQVATDALAEATEAADDWAVGWSLHLLTFTAAMQGRVADALPLYDRALSVTQANPALTDLRLLLQINKAITLGDLDQYDGAFTAAREAQQLADRAGMTVRRAQAQSCLGQLLFHTGQWDDALAEVGVLQEVSKDPAMACCDHGIAAVICFHRGEIAQARRHLAAAEPHARRIGDRVVGTLTLARSQALEHEGKLTEALDVLTAFADHAEELDEVEDLLADGVRLATTIGDTAAAQTLADQAEALADNTEIPHRQATVWHCRGLVDRDAGRLLRAAERYHDAGRPLPRAKALEAAAGALVDSGDRDPARAAFTSAVDLYSSLGAARDVARLQARFRAHGIRRAPRVKHRRARRGWDSLTPAEAKIAALVAQGMTNPQIAARLFLSHRTVATHVSHILGKLDVRSRIDIADAAVQRQSA